MDEVAIWARALTDTEVVTRWNKPLSGNEPGLLGFWNFDDGNATDLTPFGNSGTLRGDATIVSADISGFGGQHFETSASGPGSWTIKNVQAGANFKVSAYLDTNDNGVQDTTEPAGDYAGNLFDVSGDKSDIHIELTEAPRLISFTPQARGGTGSSVSLTVDAVGTAPLAYQWERDGIPLTDDGRVTGSQGPTLSIAGMNPGDDGLYRVSVSNAKGGFRTGQARIALVEGGKSISGTVNASGLVDGPIIVKATQLNLFPENQVLEVDGVTGTAEIPALKDLSGDALTVFFWFRGPNYQSAVRQQGAGFLVVGWNGQHILSSDGGTAGVLAGPNLNDGNWHRVAMSWQRDVPGGFASYLDGNLIDSRQSGPDAIPNINAPVYIGSFNAAGEFAKGQIDEVAIFRRAFSEYEIYTQWNQALTGAEDELVGLWKFDDGSVTDAGPNHYDGNQLNGASVVSASIPRLGGGDFTAILSGAGPFSVGSLPVGGNYNVTAFVDSNHNGQADANEAQASYGGNPFDLSGDLSGVVLNLIDPRDTLRITYTTEGGALRLQWGNLPGARLEATDSLAPAVWEPVAGVTGNQFSTSTTAAARFYRVALP